MMSTLLTFIRDYLNHPDQRAAIALRCAECESELRDHPHLEMTYRVVSSELELSGPGAPMKSLWVFAFRPGGESDLHKHSNSTQYSCTWTGLGKFRVGDPATAREITLTAQSTDHDPTQDWLVIPPATFHHAIASNEGWCVVSFHTVGAAELQDEPLDGTAQPYVTE